MKKETYKKAMDKIKLPEERKEEIYENIMSKQKKYNVSNQYSLPL